MARINTADKIDFTHSAEMGTIFVVVIKRGIDSSSTMPGPSLPSRNARIKKGTREKTPTGECLKDLYLPGQTPKIWTSCCLGRYLQTAL